MSVEQELISKLIHTGDFATIEDKQLTWHFFKGRNRKGINFIRKYVLSYGKVPGEMTFKKKFPSYSLYPPEEVPEPMVYYADEVRKKRTHNDILDTVEEVQGMLEERATDEVYEKLKILVNHIENNVVESDRTVGNENTESRMKDYHERATSGGMTGIPSGISLLDNLLKGFHEEELITTLAYTGVGKRNESYLSCVA